MIFGAFGSDYIRADSVELTVATVSASKKIRRAESFCYAETSSYRPPFIFYRKLGINLLFLGQLCQNFAKSEIYISDKPLQLLPTFVQMSAIVLYCLHYTLQKTRRNCDEREKQKPLLLQQLAT